MLVLEKFSCNVWLAVGRTSHEILRPSTSPSSLTFLGAAVGTVWVRDREKGEERKRECGREVNIRD